MSKTTVKNPNGTPKQIIIITPDIETPDMIHARSFVEAIQSIDSAKAVKRVLERLLPPPPTQEKIQFDYTYYPGGETDTITVQVVSSLDVLLRSYAIKHYVDGRQPHKL